MELIQKTLEKVVISISSVEIEKNGFDFIWDKIRANYSVFEFEVFSISADKINNDIYFIELIPKKEILFFKI